MLRGLGILGTGGGGDPWRKGKRLIDADYAKGRVYKIVDPKEIENSATVVSGGFLGSVAEDTSLERAIDAWEERFELEGALQEMQGLIGKKIDYLVPFEAGGGNTPVILSAGARLGIPVVDGDALGRSAPETQMTSFLGHGISLTPMPLVDSDGGVVIVKSGDIFFPDAIGRRVATLKKGLMVANAHYPMTGKQLKEVVIPNTITEAIALGKFISGLSGAPEEKLRDISSYMNGWPLFWGTVINVMGENTGGFYLATVKLKGNGSFHKQAMQLTIKNEVMCARRDGKVISIFPDLLLIIDPHTLEGIMTPQLIEGREVLVIGRPCHERLREAIRTKIGRLAFGSVRYGEDLEYVEQEKLVAAE
jgi:DUF917 family protein